MKSLRRAVVSSVAPLLVAVYGRGVSHPMSPERGYPLQIRPALALALVAALVGCEAGRFADAQREGAIASYRRFVARYPAGERADAARRQIERLIYQRARRCDRPLAYRQYLRQYPRGRFAERARNRLAALGLARARDVAALRLMVERHPDTDAGRLAARRLGDALAAAALASRQPGPAERFVARYPDHARTQAVREHLGGLRFARVAGDLAQLERFLDDFRGTSWEAKARQKIADLLLAEVRATGDRTLYEQVRVRFARDPRLPELGRLVLRKQAREALARLDLPLIEQLGRASDAPDGLAAVTRYCRRDRAHCAVARALARRAAAWRPDATVEVLARRAFDADLLRAWRAIAELGWSTAQRAGDQLLDLVASPRIASVWPAEGALSAWLARSSEATRARWLARVLRRSPRRENPDELQRHGHLLVLAGQELAGRRLLERVSRRTGRKLAASYLLARSYGRQLPGPLSKLLARAGRARLRALESAFPAAVHQESMVAALLAERELFAVAAMADAAGGPDGPRVLGELAREARALLGRWHVTLAKVDPGFIPATVVGVADAVRAHEAGREAALTALRRRRDPASTAAARAVCEASVAGDAVSAVCAGMRRQAARRRAPPPGG